MEQHWWNRFRKNKPALAGGIFLWLCTLLATFAYLIIPDKSKDANEQHLQLIALQPGAKQDFLVPKDALAAHWAWWMVGKDLVKQPIPIQEVRWNADSIAYLTAGNESGMWQYLTGLADYELQSRTYWLGTDIMGRDLWSRLVLGLRVSLGVGLIAVLISLLVGVVLGAIAGFYGGWVDQLVGWLINVIWSIPSLLLVIAFSLVMGKGMWQVFLAVGLTMWVDVARIVRGQVLSLREQEFVLAARAMGFSDWRIIFRHILPNVTGPIVIMSASNFATAILVESGLSFLGLGVQPPTASLGMMIKEHYPYIIMDAAYLAMVPGLVILLLVLAFNLFGNGLSDAFDSKQKIH